MQMSFRFRVVPGPCRSEHPIAPAGWLAQPHANDRYRIADVLPGRYSVAAWHTRKGFLSKTIVLPAKGRAAVDLFISLAIGPQQKYASPEGEPK